MAGTFCAVTERFFKNIFKHSDGTTMTYISGIEIDGETAIVRLEGEIDSHTIPIIQSNYGNIEKKLDKNILMDFEKVTKIDTSTMASLVLLLKDLRENHRKLALVNMPSVLKKYMDITRLNGLIDSYESEDIALEQLNK